jgi:hypothetical protein
MARYVLERTLPEGLGMPAGAAGAEACLAVIERNARRESPGSEDVLRPRRAESGGDPEDGRSERSSPRSKHAGPCARSVFYG